ncbi:MAG: 4Fe-4S binding protein, partial [Actinobacteria bacterium]|nr:4Fe-4S binding protein [Actinomycetota bacterium]
LDSKRVFDEVAAAASSGETAYVTCVHAINKTPQTGVKVVSCIGALRPELWFSLLVDYPNLAIYLPLEACEVCPVRGGEDLLGKAIEDAEKWSQVNMGFECDEKDLKLDKKYSVERAEFISGFLKKSVSVASKANVATAGAYKAYEKFNSHRKSLDALQATLNKLCGTPEVVQTLTPDRQLLLAALGKHGDLAAGIPLTIARTGEGCIACGVCVEACPTGARRKTDGSVKTVASYCTGCGLCRDVCAQGACELIELDATVLLKEITPDTSGIKELLSESAEAFSSSGSSATPKEASEE